MLRFSLCAILAVALLFCASGCGSPRDIQETPSSAAQASENPIVSETNLITEDSGNPVRTLYRQYSDNTEERFLLFQDALNGDASQTCTKASLRLCEHGAILSEGLLTLGWLLPTDDGTYSSTITGTLAGSGSISETDGVFQLRYDYESGKSVAGTLWENCLTYSCYAPEGNVLQRVTVLGNDGNWLSLTESEGVFTLLCFQSDIRLMTGPCPAPDPNPADNGTTIDQILNEYARGAQISLLYNEETSSLTQEVG